MRGKYKVVPSISDDCDQILTLVKPWADPSDLGLPHLRGARKLCEYLIDHVTINGKETEKALANPDHHFLVGAMAYWEACMSFVVDQPKTSLRYLQPFSKPMETTYIHMFAGISLPLFVILGRVGICVRQSRALRKMGELGWQDQIGHQMLAREVEQDAIELMEQVLNHKMPLESTFDQSDLSRSVILQLEAFAQMCKFAIMLELQRIVPKLGYCQPQQAEANRPEDGPHISAYTLQRRNHELSRAILTYAKVIPEGSTCGLYQTLLLIICGSVLQASTPQKLRYPEDMTIQQRMEVEIFATLARPDEVEKCRAFIRRRLQSNCASFGLRQVYSRAEWLLENAWTEPNAVSGPACDAWYSRHWVDIMIEQNLETFFG